MEERLLNNEKLYVELPKFTGRNVKIAEIAKATGKDPNYIRIGLQQGFLNSEQHLNSKGQVSTTTTVLIKRYGKKRDTLGKSQR